MRGAGSTVAQMPVRGDEPLTFVERLAALSHSGAFSTRCLDALAELAHHVTEVRWQAGEEIWKVAAAAEHFLLPVAGRIRAQVPGAGSVTFHPGATVGMHEALGGRARWYGAHSDAATRALRIEVEPFVDILEDHFDLALDFLAVLAGRLLALQRPAEAA